MPRVARTPCYSWSLGWPQCEEVLSICAVSCVAYLAAGPGGRACALLAFNLVVVVAGELASRLPELRLVDDAGATGAGVGARCS